MINKQNNMNPEEEAPPFFKSWKGMYWLVIGNLIFMIILFYWLTLYYS